MSDAEPEPGTHDEVWPFIHLVHEHSDAVFVLDAQGRVKYANRAAEHVAASFLVSMDELRAMEERVEERSRELAAANVRLQEVDRVKSEFLATMSHELRTPLNSIIGFTSLLVEGLPGPVNEEQHKQLTLVLGSARQLLELINEILDLSKIEAGQMSVTPEPLDVGHVVRQVVDSMMPQFARKELALILEGCEDAPRILCDRRRLVQILTNLLSNAVKFTPAGQVRVTCARRDGEVHLSVADTGIGISEPHLRLLFLPFRQIDSTTTRRYEGSGLGLYLCRKLADMLGGSLEVHSRLGEGSTFTLRLPFGHDGP